MSKNRLKNRAVRGFSASSSLSSIVTNMSLVGYRMLALKTGQGRENGDSQKWGSEQFLTCNFFAIKLGFAKMGTHFQKIDKFEANRKHFPTSI